LNHAAGFLKSSVQASFATMRYNTLGIFRSGIPWGVMQFRKARWIHS